MMNLTHLPPLGSGWRRQTASRTDALQEGSQKLMEEPELLQRQTLKN
jgi:hypothetical protein